MGTSEFPLLLFFAYQGAETTSMGQAFELPIKGMVGVFHNKVDLKQHLLITEQTSNFITDDFETKLFNVKELTLGV